jgi:ribosome maturation factor RimP
MAMATKRDRSAASIVGAVRPTAERVAAEHDLVCWDVAFLREAGRDTLRVACDRRGGVTADDLAVYSEALSREIDREDVVPGEATYVLEVTSPGAERRLETAEQYEVCTGRVARLSLTDGRTIEGPIAGVSARAVEIGGEEGTTRALFEDIAKAQLVVKL